jgi:hypothetical protein
MTASAFKFNQLVKTPDGRGYVIGKIEEEKDLYMVQIDGNKPTMKCVGPCKEFKGSDLTPIDDKKGK